MLCRGPHGRLFLCLSCFPGTALPGALTFLMGFAFCLAIQASHSISSKHTQANFVEQQYFAMHVNSPDGWDFNSPDKRIEAKGFCNRNDCCSLHLFPSAHPECKGCGKAIILGHNGIGGTPPLSVCKASFELQLLADKSLLAAAPESLQKLCSYLNGELPC